MVCDRTGNGYPLEEYIRSGEPSQVEKSGAWRTAIGLQEVDGLKPSTCLVATAKHHSWCFRNALVRANNPNLQKGISATALSLERLLGNLLLGGRNDLKSRETHAKSVDGGSVQGVKGVGPKCNFGTLEEAAVLLYLSGHPMAKQKSCPPMSGSRRGP